MRVRNSMQLAVAALVAGMLAACGGGGSTDSGTTTPVTAIVTNVSGTVAVGKSFVVSGSAVSQPNTMSTMAWTVTNLTAGAGDTTIANGDCANGQRSSKTLNNITQSTWACDAVVTAPATLSGDATYRVTFTGTDAKGNTGSAYRDVTITAGGGIVTPTPTLVVTAQSAVSVAAASDVGLNCLGSGGNIKASGKYVYSWVVKGNSAGLSLTMTQPGDGSLTFKAPVVVVPTNLTVECRVTDDAPTTAVADTVVTITPSATSAPIAVTGPTQTVAENTQVSLDATASQAPANTTLFYKWTQTEGQTVSLSDSTAAMPSFVSPAVSDTTRLTFQLAAGTTSPVDPATAAPASLATVSVYVMPQQPLSLSISGASVVATGTAVSLQATVTPSGGAYYYAWTQVSGPSVTIGGANTATASFISPTVAGSPVDSVFSVSVSRKPLAQSLPAEIVSADVVVRTTP